MLDIKEELYAGRVYSIGWYIVHQHYDGDAPETGFYITLSKLIKILDRLSLV